MARHRKLTQKFAGFPIFKVGTSGDTFPVTSPFTTGFTGYGDGLSLDLQFATDKTLTARKGPTPVFTRSSGDNRGTTYFGPSSINAIFTFDGNNYNVNMSQSTLLNGRYRWEDGDTLLSYNGTAWSLSQDGNAVATSTLTSAFRPDGANWSGTAAVVTATSTIGIVRAANNEPRFDHDPITLACKGLLIEESRTNSIFQSENFASATWVKGGGSISSVANVAPNGNANSELFSEDASTGSHRVFQSFVGTIGTTYTLSVFLKFNGRAEVLLENRSIGTNPNAIFNIQNGTIGFVSAGLTAAIQAYPNGWYRCSITGTATLAGGNYLISGYLAAASYTGSNGPAFYIYGAQVEAGSFPTSYIPTTTASLARSADVCSITGSAFTGFWNQSEGTLLSQTQKASTNANAFIISASDGSFGNETDLRYNSVSVVAALINVSSISQVSGFQANITSGAAVKTSIAYKLNDCAYAANGASPVLDTSALIPTVDRLTIGNVAVVGNNFYMNGHIASIRYYKKRLANAKLQQLTT